MKKIGNEKTEVKLQLLILLRTIRDQLNGIKYNEIVVRSQNSLRVLGFVRVSRSEELYAVSINSAIIYKFGM